MEPLFRKSSRTELTTWTIQTLIRNPRIPFRIWKEIRRRLCIQGMSTALHMRRFMHTCVVSLVPSHTNMCYTYWGLALVWASKFYLAWWSKQSRCDVFGSWNIQSFLGCVLQGDGIMKRETIRRACWIRSQRQFWDCAEKENEYATRVARIDFCDNTTLQRLQRTKTSYL